MGSPSSVTLQVAVVARVLMEPGRVMVSSQGPLSGLPYTFPHPPHPLPTFPHRGGVPYHLPESPPKRVPWQEHAPRQVCWRLCPIRVGLEEKGGRHQSQEPGRTSKRQWRDMRTALGWGGGSGLTQPLSCRACVAPAGLSQSLVTWRASGS